ncbi:MAG: c-type cytochrome [Pirellulales bacterium]
MQDAGQPVALRVKAIETAVALRGDALIEQLRKLLASDVAEVRKATLDALTALQDVKSIRETLLDAKTNAAERDVVVKGSLRSAGGALGLLKLIDDKTLPKGTADLIVAQAIKHPDSNVRVLYEKYVPIEQRQKKLGDAIKADEILKLTPDVSRGKRIFAESNSAQCKNCHMVDGVGGTQGPDLGLIGKKYERGVLLETILQPSKAISHGYEAYLLETTQGQTYLGFLVEDGEKQVVLKDINSQVIRVPKGDVESLQKQAVSLMPELVLKDVTAQDAADLLGYLTTLVESTTAAQSLRLAGPFAGKNLDQAHEIEKTVAAPDLKATYKGQAKQPAGWEVVASDGKLGFPGIDTVKFDKSHGTAGTDCTHYALLFVDSLTDQKAKLLIGSDDGCKVWLNGTEIFRNDASRALAFGQETLPVELKRGRNVVVVKVVNGNAPGGVALGVRTGDAVTLKTE